MTDYAIVRVADKSIVQRFSGIPKSLTLPNRKRIVSPVLPEHTGVELDGFRFVEVEEAGARPGEFYRPAKRAVTLSTTKLTVDTTWEAWTQEEIDAEKAQRARIETDEALTGRLGKILFALAKETRPNLTEQQFRTWSESL